MVRDLDYFIGSSEEAHEAKNYDVDDVDFSRIDDFNVSQHNNVLPWDDDILDMQQIGSTIKDIVTDILTSPKENDLIYKIEALKVYSYLLGELAKCRKECVVFIRCF